MTTSLRQCCAGLALAVLAGCAERPAADAPLGPKSAAAGCLADGSGRFEAEVRGAFSADIAWGNAQMDCDGGPRPDGQGLRVTMAGAAGERRLRFIFGIDLADTAAGAAQVLPTNLTVIVEGQARIYATRGADKCALENLELAQLPEGAQRVAARGYCIGPATDMAASAPLFVPTFAFTALMRQEPAHAAPGP